jgi:signal transduction histidine kinase
MQMADAEIIGRMAAILALSQIPREEMLWLAAHGDPRVWEAGTVVAPKGKPIVDLWIVLSGHIAIRVDRGAGPRQVMEWRTGDIGGLLPYSRMTGPPGDAYLEERTEILLIHKKHFPEMIRQCPMFTAKTVHIMLDRARTFNTSDLQDEKMISLGKLAAGLAHELNNPASATVRSAKLLLAGLAKADSAARALGAAGLTDEMIDALERTRAACLAKPGGAVLSPIEQADREDEIADWLRQHSSDPDHAASLAETAITIDELNIMASAIQGDTLDAALRWICTGCATHSLAVDIERAATRIYELVAAVKKFTYMDKLAGPESVDVEAGLRDTIRVVASKAKSKGAAITLDIEPNLPHARANGGELNQVWLNLIDNALDAISQSGRIDIIARKELDRIVVRVVDNGEGIPPDVGLRIFDPFFTTKPPGQGTGLGLDVTRRLLRRYHGDILVDSHPGRTEFRVSLLIAEPGTAKANPSSVATEKEHREH